jgi:hypothetical protein
VDPCGDLYPDDQGNDPVDGGGLPFSDARIRMGRSADVDLSGSVRRSERGHDSVREQGGRQAVRRAAECAAPRTDQGGVTALVTDAIGAARQ